jgi:ABC-type transporter Mla maintaining outer membrane lipid asymmetry permease subunit MlaE
VSLLLTNITEFFGFIGELGVFGARAVQRSFTRPFEFRETVHQIYEAGWRSLPLVIASGFAFGVILALQTRAEMQSFGAGAMIPQAVSTGLFRDIGAIIAALLVAAGRHACRHMGAADVSAGIRHECFPVDGMDRLCSTYAETRCIWFADRNGCFLSRL